MKMKRCLFSTTNSKFLILRNWISPNKPQQNNAYQIFRPWTPNGDDNPLNRKLIEEPIEEPLSFKKVVLWSKQTRYEFEKMIANQPTEKDFERYLNSLGSDYQHLLERNERHHRSVDRFVETLQKAGIEVQVITRSGFNHENLKADAVFTAGGDGTFLQAASWVKTNKVPCIGINTDPSRSQGHLCLPDLPFEKIMDRLQTGRYRWLNRQRIEVSMACPQLTTIGATDLHAPSRPSIEYHVRSLPPDPENPGFVLLPTLALNEIFIGENNNAITAYYEVSIDNQPIMKQKSSGLTVSTGTGSTSWYYTICALHPSTCKSLLDLGNEIYRRDIADKKGGLPTDDPEFVDAVCEEYNANLQFHAEDRKMAYASRDPIVNEVFKVPNIRGYCKIVRLKSRMADGILVLDGGHNYKFSIGAEAILKVTSEKQALRTVSFFHPRNWNRST